MVTDYDIQALVDNELDEEKKIRVRHYIETNPQARERYDSLIRQKELLQIWWKSKKLN